MTALFCFRFKIFDSPPLHLSSNFYPATSNQQQWPCGWAGHKLSTAHSHWPNPYFPAQPHLRLPHHLHLRCQVCTQLLPWDCQLYYENTAAVGPRWPDLGAGWLLQSRVGKWVPGWGPHISQSWAAFRGPESGDDCLVCHFSSSRMKAISRWKVVGFWGLAYEVTLWFLSTIAKHFSTWLWRQVYFPLVKLVLQQILFLIEATDFIISELCHLACVFEVCTIPAANAGIVQTGFSRTVGIGSFFPWNLFFYWECWVYRV